MSKPTAVPLKKIFFPTVSDKSHVLFELTVGKTFAKFASVT